MREVLLITFAVMASACGSNSANPDAGHLDTLVRDGAADTAVDMSPADGPTSDAQGDAAADEGGSDSRQDAADDGRGDTLMDGSADVTPDAGPDATDLGADAELDSAAEASPDGQPDLLLDAAPDQTADASCQSHADCDDGLACTTDICGVGGCVYIKTSGYCVINGACVSGGTKDPQSDCRWCQPFQDDEGWSNRVGSCNDGNACTYYDQCAAGVCAGKPYSCDDGLSCTENMCDGIGPSGFGGGCYFPVQVGKCAIDGTCYGAGDQNPTIACEQCVPISDPSKWTYSQTVGCSVVGKPCSQVGASCGSGLACSYLKYCSESCSPSNPCAPPAGMNAMCGTGPAAGTCVYICASGSSSWSCPSGLSCNVTAGGVTFCGP